jgi:hypothetical protein
MGTVKHREQPAKSSDVGLTPPTGGDPGGHHDAPAWEQIEPGRYRPRRIRGSFPGRELG